MEFKEYLKSEGVRHELTISKTPEQNGVPEQMNRTLVETVHSMIIGTKLSKKFWAESLLTAVYLRNHSPSKAIVGMTPSETSNGISFPCVWMCTVCSH